MIPVQRDIKKMENIQQRATKVIRGLDNLTYEESLKDLGLRILEKRSIIRDLITVFQYKVAADKMEALPSQGSTVRGQEPMDTSCLIRNFVWV